ncbi:MAG TPA: carboxypeptidase-like regulatory domain-containing protein [Vicinamibacterales bacterium]|nr:carboxypeptidase-like regulatory domain-containing protein [Vicinamibacterales bacterium]
MAGVCVPAAATAQGAAPAVSAGRATAATARLSGRVFGFVWNASNDPIANANVRLRNVTTGGVEAHAVSAENGEFSFGDLEGGTYVVECVDGRGRVLGVSHVFSIWPGETVATFIRLGDRAPWLAALFGSGARAAATTVATAASLGLTALAPAARHVTPER